MLPRAPSVAPVRQEPTAPRAGTSMKGVNLLGAFAAFAVLLSLGVLLSVSRPQQPAGAVTESPATSLSADGAQAIAQDHMPSDARAVRTVAGPISEVYSTSANEPAPYQGLSATTWVWVVTFSRQIVICPPDGSACQPPRTGTSQVVLDYSTGAFEFSTTVAPAP